LAFRCEVELRAELSRARTHRASNSGSTVSVARRAETEGVECNGVGAATDSNSQRFVHAEPAQRDTGGAHIGCNESDAKSASTNSCSLPQTWSRESQWHREPAVELRAQGDHELRL